jgi:cAMP phosphodiesterase
LGLRVFVFTKLRELEAVVARVKSSQRRKNEDRSKLFIEKLRSFKPKIRKVSLRMSFFEQSPSFATNHLAGPA